MTTIDIYNALFWMAALVGAVMLGLHFLSNWAAAIAARRERERMRDRVFRDALDTIHHLRVENDNLTFMVMAMADKEQD